MNNIDKISEQEFPQADDLYYLNHAAVSPWPKRSVLAVQAFAEENLILGATQYPEWIKKETQLRSQISNLIGAHSTDEIALLKNTSEALSVVAEGIDWHPTDRIVTSDQEFPSNRIPWKAQEKHGVKLIEVDLYQSESPEQALIEACDEQTRLLTISSVQYSTGLKMDITTLGRFCKENNILFCVDAIQSLGAHDIHVEKSHIDFLMADAHKWLMGPEGIALFYCRKDKQNMLELHQYGWHMIQNAGNYDIKTWQAANNAKRFECGSPNMLGIHALSASLDLINEVGIEQIESAISEKTDQIIDSLVSSSYDIISATESNRRSGILTLINKQKDMKQLHQHLMQQNIICAYRGGGIRLSPHFYTPEFKIKKVLEVLNIIN